MTSLLNTSNIAKTVWWPRLCPYLLGELTSVLQTT